MGAGDLPHSVFSRSREADTDQAPPPEYEEVDSQSSLIPEEEAERDRQLIEALERHDFESFRQTVPSVAGQPPPDYPRLESMLPCVIPQASTSTKGAFMCPFVRGYPPGLHARGIDERDFLKFLDDFNESWVFSPAMQVASLAGFAMSNVRGTPVEWAGIGLQVASVIGGNAMSYFRTRAYVKAANEMLFHPLGLTCQVLTTKKLADKIGYPHEKLELLPMHQSDLEKTSETPQVSGSSKPAVVRRLQALDGYIQPLDLDVPPSVSSDNFLKRMGEWQAKRQLKKQEGKLDKRRAKVGRKEHKLERKQMRMDSKLDSLEQRLEGIRLSRDRQLASQSAQTDSGVRQQIEAEYLKESAKLERKLEKKGVKRERKLGKKRGKADRKRVKVDKREEKIANKVRWIVISNWEPRDAAKEAAEESEDSDSESDSESSSDGSGH